METIGNVISGQTYFFCTLELGRRIRDKIKKKNIQFEIEIWDS